MKTPLCALLVFTGCILSSSADDWPQWRGGQRDGVWRETGIVERIPESGLAVRWQVRVGNGYSAPSVAQGRVFVTDHVFDPELERVLCFDEATGKLLWTHRYPVDYKDMEYGNGPRAAPTVQDGRVYTLGTQGHLFCLDTTTGAVMWSKELEKDFKAKNPRYGVSAAPLVAGDLLIFCAGGQPDACVVALDRRNGELRWHALPDRPGYSAPIMIKAGGVEQLIMWTADSITSFDAPSGKTHWQMEWHASFDPAQMVATPVLHNDTLLLMGAWGRGSKMLRLDATKPAAIVFWETRKDPTTTHTTPLFQEDGHFYANLADGSIACLDAATGDKVWSSEEPTGKRMASAHLVRNGDRVFLFNHSGHLILARLTPQGYEERGRCLLVEPTAGYRAQGALTWAHPAFANKCVFARSDRQLVCASLAADQTVATVASQPAIQSRAPAGFPVGGTALAFSPDGKALAVGGGWGEGVKIVGLATAKPLPTPPPIRDFLCAVAWSSDANLMVLAGGNEFTPSRNGGKTVGQIKLFDVTAGKERGELVGHSNKVFTAVFAPDGKTIASGSADNTVRLWDVATLKERFVLSGHADAILSVAFSPDGGTLASASMDHRVKLWDTSTGKPLGAITAIKDEVRAVAFSPDGKLLATGGAEPTVRLWDASTLAARAELRGHRGGINTLAFSSDGQLLASGSGDETIKIWTVSTATERWTLRGPRGAVVAVSFTPDARTLASISLGETVRLWQLPQQP